MRAFVFDGSLPRIIDTPSPVLTPQNAIVDVHLAGVCNTDLEIVKGYMGFQGTLGHEFVGTVSQGPRQWLGKRVVGEINFACGSCDFCARRLGRHCPTRTVMGILGANGAFADKLAVPVENLHLVPDSVSDKDAVFTEPLAAAFEILEQIHIVPGMRCLVLGDGKLGLLVAQVLYQAGAHVLVVGKHHGKLDILRARGLSTALLSDWDKSPADLVVEATGSKDGFAMAVQATLPRGKLVLKSTVVESVSIHLAQLVINEVTVVGSRCGPFQPALRALANKSIDVASLVSATLPLDQASEALQLARQSDVMKVLVEVHRR